MYFSTDTGQMDGKEKSRQNQSLSTVTVPDFC